MKNTIALSFLIILLGGCLSSPLEVTNFEECAAAGYPIMESYPKRCRTPDGQTFTRQLTDEEQKKLEPPT